MNDPQMQVRQATIDDMPFVMASWFESFWKRTARHISPEFDSFKFHYGALMQRIAESSAIPVVFISTVPDEIVGYAIHSGPVLHYVYVKSAYRRNGFADTLMQHIKPAIHTHYTSAFKKLAVKHKTTYTPWMLYDYQSNLPNRPRTDTY